MPIKKKIKPPVGEWTSGEGAYDRHAIQLLHTVDGEKLERVKQEMREMGPPVIRAVYFQESDLWYAAEGTHRLSAAHALGLTPIIKKVSWATSARINNDETGNRKGDSGYETAATTRSAALRSRSPWLTFKAAR